MHNASQIVSLIARFCIQCTSSSTPEIWNNRTRAWWKADCPNHSSHVAARKASVLRLLRYERRLYPERRGPGFNAGAVDPDAGARWMQNRPSGDVYRSTVPQRKASIWEHPARNGFSRNASDWRRVPRAVCLLSQRKTTSDSEVVTTRTTATSTDVPAARPIAFYITALVLIRSCFQSDDFARGRIRWRCSCSIYGRSLQVHHWNKLWQR